MSIKGDLIETLPPDDSMYDEKLANVLFKEQKTISNVFKELKETIIVVILFVAFSSEAFDKLVKNLYKPAETNPIALLAIKCVAVAVFYYILKNFEFAKSK